MKSSYNIYMRQEAKDILKALDKNNLLIEGAPGTGKSSIVWFWACYQEKFSVCWISAGAYRKQRITFLTKGKIVSSKPYEDINQIRFLDLPPVDCLILDGLTQGFKQHLLWAGAWLDCKLETRRLIITTSVHAEIKQEQLFGMDMKRIFMEGWTFEEYEAALKDPGFVLQHPDISTPENLEAKFDVAGA